MMYKTVGVFESYPKQKMFTYSLPQLTADKYKLAGQLLQWSIQHDGRGIPVLLPDLHSYIPAEVSHHRVIQNTT